MFCMGSPVKGGCVLIKMSSENKGIVSRNAFELNLVNRIIFAS